MPKFLSRALGVSLLVLVPGLSGCSDEHPPITTEPNKLTPGMEKMKEEMLKSFQTKSLGKSPGDATKK